MRLARARLQQVCGYCIISIVFVSNECLYRETCEVVLKDVHADNINSVVCFQEMVLTASSDGTAKVFDCFTWLPVTTFQAR